MQGEVTSSSSTAKLKTPAGGSGCGRAEDRTETKPQEEGEDVEEEEEALRSALLSLWIWSGVFSLITGRACGSAQLVPRASHLLQLQLCARRRPTAELQSRLLLASQRRRRRRTSLLARAGFFFPFFFFSFFSRVSTFTRESCGLQWRLAVEAAQRNWWAVEWSGTCLKTQAVGHYFFLTINVMHLKMFLFHHILDRKCTVHLFWGKLK